MRAHTTGEGMCAACRAAHPLTWAMWSHATGAPTTIQIGRRCGNHPTNLLKIDRPLKMGTENLSILRILSCTCCVQGTGPKDELAEEQDRESHRQRDEPAIDAREQRREAARAIALALVEAGEVKLTRTLASERNERLDRDHAAWVVPEHV